MSRRDERGSLKGKHRLFVGCCANTLLQRLGGRGVHLDLKKFGQAVLKTNHIQQRQVLFVIKFRDQIDIGRIIRFSSGNRTEHAQMDDTSGGQFVPVFAQLRDDLTLVMTLFCPISRSFTTRLSRMHGTRPWSVVDLWALATSMSTPFVGRKPWSKGQAMLITWPPPAARNAAWVSMRRRSASRMSAA